MAEKCLARIFHQSGAIHSVFSETYYVTKQYVTVQYGAEKRIRTSDLCIYNAMY